jgi:pimeloyl-ACP methyl ester carboxylesterase
MSIAQVSAPARAEPKLERSVLSVGDFDVNRERWHGGDRHHVLLLHGLGGNSITWHGVAPLVATRASATVLAVDLPGFGRSRTGGRRVDCRELSRVIEAVLTSSAPPGTRWTLAGNSLGGLLALELAGRAPELVSGVSVAGLAMPLTWGRSLSQIPTLLSWVPAAIPRLGGRLIARYMSRTGLPGVVDEPIEALFGDPTRLDPELREELLAVSGYRLGWVAEAARAYEQTTRSLGVALLLPGRAARWIREAPAQVQVVHGAKDPLFSVAAWQTLKRVRPDWDHTLLPDIGHVPQLEAPADVAHELVRWLGAASQAHAHR